MAYIAQSDLENALGKSIVKAIFDDDGDGAPEPAAIAACCDYASSECDSFLRGQYGVTFPISSPPAELKFAAVDFACAYAARRRPDVVRAMGEKSWTDFREAAVEKMKRFAASLQRLPPTVATPSNVGGSTSDDTPRLTVASSDGTPNLGDF